MITSSKHVEQMKYGHFTLKPKQKRINEDYYDFQSISLTKESPAQIFVIADGMGGYEDGEVASLYAVQQIMNWFKTLPLEENTQDTVDANKIVEQLLDKFQMINNRLINTGNIQNKKTGTTLTVLLVINSTFIIVHVGDSVVYRYREMQAIQAVDDDTIDLSEYRKFTQLTEDHVKEIKKGNVEVPSHILTQCLGVKGPVEPFIKQGRVREKDLFLLATDGLKKIYSSKEIAAFMEEDILLEEKIKKMYAAMQAEKVLDDVTVILNTHDM